MKDVMIVTGAGQISMAIARRMGYGKKIIMEIEFAARMCLPAILYLGIEREINIIFLFEIYVFFCGKRCKRII